MATIVLMPRTGRCAASDDAPFPPAALPQRFPARARVRVRTPRRHAHGVLDFFIIIVSVSLPDIHRDLKPTHAVIELILVGYGIAYAAAVIVQEGTNRGCARDGAVRR